MPGKKLPNQANSAANPGQGQPSPPSGPARTGPAARPGVTSATTTTATATISATRPPTSTSQSLSRLARGSRRSARRASPRPSSPDAAKATAGSSPAPGTIQTMITRMPQDDERADLELGLDHVAVDPALGQRPAAPGEQQAGHELDVPARAGRRRRPRARCRPRRGSRRRSPRPPTRCRRTSSGGARSTAPVRPPISASGAASRTPHGAGQALLRDHHPDPAEQQADDRELHQQDGDGHGRRSSARAVMTSRSRPRSNQATPSGGSAWRRPQ